MARTWVTGEVITAKKLNQLEQSVASNTTTVEWARTKINGFDANDDGVVDQASTALDVSDSLMSNVVASLTEFPVPAQGESMKIILGKIIKWFSDARTHMKTSLLTVGTKLTVSSSAVLVNDTIATTDDSKNAANTEYVKANLRRYSANDDGTVDRAVYATSAGNAATVNNHTIAADVPSDAEFTDTTDLSDMTGNLDLTSQVTGALPVANGGTGKTSVTSGSVLVGNGTGAMTEKAFDSTPTVGSHNMVDSDAVANAISAAGGGDMMKSTYDPDDDGVIAIAQGGTGATTASGARSALSAASSTDMTNAYNMIRNSSTDAYSSSKAYKVGDYVIYSNKLYKCITACSAGSWATNQSCFEQTTLTKAVTNLNASLTNTPTWETNGDIKYRKCGNIVELSIRVDSKSDGYLLGTLPAGYRPDITMLVPNAFAASTSKVQISPTDGTVYFQNTSSATNVRVQVMFFV